jgi:histidinol-phosphate/aromatic aminotransferase/cobyric acid decarboxylase-like protein
LGWEIVPGVANFLLCHLPSPGPDAATVVRACREHGLFLRDAALMGSQLGTHAIRIAVKDQATNQRMIEILRRTTETTERSHGALMTGGDSERVEATGNATVPVLTGNSSRR